MQPQLLKVHVECVCVCVCVLTQPLSCVSCLQASLPVQELLGMPLNRDREEMRAARLLPV